MTFLPWFARVFMKIVVSAKYVPKMVVDKARAKIVKIKCWEKIVNIIMWDVT